MRDQRSHEGKITKNYQELNKFIDYFLNKSANNLESYMPIRALILEDDVEGDYFFGLLEHKIKGELSLSV